MNTYNPPPASKWNKIGEFVVGASLIVALLFMYFNLPRASDKDPNFGKAHVIVLLLGDGRQAFLAKDGTWWFYKSEVWTRGDRPSCCENPVIYLEERVLLDFEEHPTPKSTSNQGGNPS
jgi:hypothetical protein